MHGITADPAVGSGLAVDRQKDPRLPVYGSILQLQGFHVLSRPCIFEEYILRMTMDILSLNLFKRVKS